MSDGAPVHREALMHATPHEFAADIPSCAVAAMLHDRAGEWRVDVLGDASTIRTWSSDTRKHVRNALVVALCDALDTSVPKDL